MIEVEVINNDSVRDDKYTCMSCMTKDDKVSYYVKAINGRRTIGTVICKKCLEELYNKCLAELYNNCLEELYNKVWKSTH